MFYGDLLTSTGILDEESGNVLNDMYSAYEYQQINEDATEEPDLGDWWAGFVGPVNQPTPQANAKSGSNTILMVVVAFLLAFFFLFKRG